LKTKLFKEKEKSIPTGKPFLKHCFSHGAVLAPPRPPRSAHAVSDCLPQFLRPPRNVNRCLLFPQGICAIPCDLDHVHCLEPQQNSPLGTRRLTPIIRCNLSARIATIWLVPAPGAANDDMMAGIQVLCLYA
jgi:hypothetical protein